MRIVHIEDFFHPDAGYQVNILSRYQTAAGHEVIILTSELEQMPEYLTNFFGREGIQERDRSFEEAVGARIIRLPLRAYISGRSIYTAKLDETIAALKPDVLYVHGNDTWVGMHILSHPKKYPCVIVSDSHMVDIASKNKLHGLFAWFYRTWITPKIRKNHIPVMRTADDNYIEHNFHIPLKDSPVVPLASNTMLFHADQAARQKFRAEHGISDNAFVVLYIGKLDENKGGLFLAETLKAALCGGREIIAVVVGSTVGDYGKQVEEKFSASENRILRFPTQKYPDMPVFFQMADIGVLPHQCSLSLFDAEACGLPMVCEDNKLNQLRLSCGNGVCFQAGSVADFRQKILDMEKLSPEEYRQLQQNAVRYVQENFDYAVSAHACMDVIQAAQEKQAARIGRGWPQ